MYSTVTLFYTAILFWPLLCDAQIKFKYINGTLSNAWNFNFTFYSTSLEGNILYFADYEKNNLIVLINSRGTLSKNIIIRYNKEAITAGIKSLCGCDPCEEKMMNFFIKSAGGVIELKCNHFGHESLQKIDIANRVNNHMPKNIQLKTNRSNEIYTSVALEKTGCLESFYHNGEKITFEELGTNFLTSCAQSCIIGACNDGKCRALDPIGPMCDCSATARNGQYCNNSLVAYIPGSNNSYKRKNDFIDVDIKLTWKQPSNKKYCLLEFIHTYGHVTLSMFDNLLMRGADLITKIDSDGMNFINIIVTNSRVTIKVNNKILSTQIVIFGEFTLNIGFTEKNDKCDTFKGEYDFQYNSSQLIPLGQWSTSTNVILNQSVAVTQLKMDLKVIILAAGSSILVTILLLALIMAIICVNKFKNKTSVIHENIYERPRINVKYRANRSLLDDALTYDTVEDEYLEPVHPPNGPMQPPLPDRMNSLPHIQHISNPLPSAPPRNSR